MEQNNRTIKFRAKTIKQEGWTQKWVYGYFFETPLTVENFGAGHLGDRKRYCISTNDGPSQGVVYEIDISTLGQYSGEVDYNGKEIYENDIVEVWQECYCTEDDDGNDVQTAETKSKSLVEFKSGGFVISADFGDFQSTTVGWATDWSENKLYIIGNIIDSKELLK